MNCIREKWHLDDFDCKKKSDESTEALHSDQHSWFGEIEDGCLKIWHKKFWVMDILITFVDNAVP